MRALIIVSQGLEECEALLTYDLLYRAGIKVDLIGLDKEINSSHNVLFKAHKLIDDINIEEYDCLILPGGMPGTLNLENNETVSNMIDYFIKNNKLIAAICAAPSILIHKGLLKDREFTCYPSFESGYISTNEKVTQKDNIITGKGLGACFEFAYVIIKNLINEEKAQEVLNTIQY